MFKTQISDVLVVVIPTFQRKRENVRSFVVSEPLGFVDLSTSLPFLPSPSSLLPPIITRPLP